MNKEIFRQRAIEADIFCKEHHLISALECQQANPFYPEHLNALKINRMQMFLHLRPSMDMLVMSNGILTVQEWLLTQPKEWVSIETEAILVCLKRGWTLNAMTIQSVARELSEMQNLKG